MKNESLPLRLGVGIVLLNNDKKVFVGKRIDNPTGFWQMPQGGVNKNESFFDAAKRELEEETGIKSVRLIKELDYWLTYDLPKNLLGKIWKGKYRGQKQKWFIVRFVGNDTEINLETSKPEFIEWQWLDIEKLPIVIVEFKKRVYEELLPKIRSFIN